MYDGKEFAKGVLRTRKGLAIELEALCKELGCSYQVMQQCIPVLKSANIPVFLMHRPETPTVDFPVIMVDTLPSALRYMAQEMPYLPGTFTEAIDNFATYLLLRGIRRTAKVYAAPELIVKEQLGDNASWEDVQRVMREIEAEKQELKEHGIEFQDGEIFFQY